MRVYFSEVKVDEYNEELNLTHIIENLVEKLEELENRIKELEVRDEDRTTR